MKRSANLDPRLVRLSALCDKLPEATRELQGEHATFRVKGKVFAYFLNNHHGDGMVAVACRTARGENADWIAANPDRFFMPAYVGPRGYVGLRLDVGKVDWKEVADLVRDSYRMAAPKRLAARLPSRP